MNFKSIITEWLSLFYPRCCVVCDNKLLLSEKSVCLACIYKLPRTNDFRYPGNQAETLLAGRFPFERVATFCVFSKQGILQPMIHQLKYNQKREIGVLLGKLYGQDLVGSDFVRGVDFIVPVPLHPKKLRSRGYNQSEMFACGLSQSLGIPVSTDNLIRVVNNPTQTKRTRMQRWENVKDIFSVLNADLYAEKHILLVDDVITTGSTLEACAHALSVCENVKLSIATIGDVF